jgi:hypothetical protein
MQNALEASMEVIAKSKTTRYDFSLNILLVVALIQ